MTGNDIYKQACSLLNYEANETEKARETALNCLNNILCDLGISEAVENLETDIKVSPTNAFITAFGVAMLLAEIRLDTVRRGWMAEVYNVKRAQVKSEIISRKETFPGVTA